MRRLRREGHTGRARERVNGALFPRPTRVGRCLEYSATTKVARGTSATGIRCAIQVAFAVKDEVRIRIRTIAVPLKLWRRLSVQPSWALGESLKTVPLEPPPPCAVVP
jgi:hypothetical protein